MFVVYLSDAYDPLDPNGNITINWDVMSWTPDGYVVSTFSYNITCTNMKTYVVFFAFLSTGWFHLLSGELLEILRKN